MKNIMGDERAPQPLTFEWKKPHLYLFRNGRWVGMVCPNGWTGKSRLINYKLAEPILTNYQGELSLTEMAQIQEAWKLNNPDVHDSVTHYAMRVGSRLNNLRRLEEENKLLASCLADERRLRQRAYKWYMDRLKSKWIGLMDMSLLAISALRWKGKE